MDFAVIWDWDGVVIDSRRQHERSWELLAEERGLPLFEGHFEQGFGMRNAVIIPELLNWSDDPAEIQALGDRKEALYRELLQNDPLETLTGVRELLDALKTAGTPCVVGSSTPRINLEVSIEALGLEGYFSALTASEDVSHGKPHPEVFLKAAEKAGTLPKRCIVIEDTVHGIEAGLAGGMKTLACATTLPAERLRKAGAHRVVGRLSEVSLSDLAALAAL